MEVKRLISVELVPSLVRHGVPTFDLEQRWRPFFAARWRSLLRLDARVRRLVRRFAPNESQRIFGLTVVIGLVCGFTAVAFHLAIRAVERVAIGRAYEAGIYSMLWIPLTPAIGGALAGVLLQYVVPNARGSGVPQVKVAFASNRGLIRFRDALGKFVISSLQIGTGSSLGREGPTVQICGGVASTLGRLIGIPSARLRQLLPVGVAAGIAAAFNAPISAVTFTIEEIVGTLDQTLLSGIVVAAAFAAVIERSVLGEHPVFAVSSSYGLHDPSQLIFYAVLGIAAAVVSVAFTDALLWTRKHFSALRTVPPWARPAIGGLVTGGLALTVLLAVGSKGITGGGYDTLSQALSGTLGLKILAVLCATKIFATVFSYGSGGAGGIFAPSLFIGGMLGGVIGSFDIAIFGHPVDTRGAFALVGMGAVFSGIIRAPITSVLIIFEMTGGYSLILPLMIANMTSYVLARYWRRDSIYEALLKQDGIDLHRHSNLDVTQRLSVDGIMVRDRPFISFAPQVRLEEIFVRVSSATWQDVYPVMDTAGSIAGLIVREDLHRAQEHRGIEAPIAAVDLMRPTVVLAPQDSLRRAFELLVQNDLREAPVVDTGCVVGFIDQSEIVGAYLAATAKVPI